MSSARQIAFLILQEIARKSAYTDIAIDRFLQSSKLSEQDKGFVCELVYGCVRRQRTLDALIDQLAKKKAQDQPLEIRLVLHLGLYQLRYLENIPVSASVNTSVELIKKGKFKGLSGVVNGILRQYVRLKQDNSDPLQLPNNTINRLGVLHSFPDELITTWVKEWGEPETELLCQWFNQIPSLDLRINPLKTTLEKVRKCLEEREMITEVIPTLPQGLRIKGKVGNLQAIPEFNQGWFSVQDGSAQLVTHILDPQPQETIIDVCSAPGGKTCHIAELMGDQGTIFALDLHDHRLKKVQQNYERLGLKSIRIQQGDGRSIRFSQQVDRILLDTPCSGSGTLHKRPDLRWKQDQQTLVSLIQTQKELLNHVSQWVKPQGILVYSTCTLNSLENEIMIQNFLQENPQWTVISPERSSPFTNFITPQDYYKILPHHHNMDGFFIVKLQKG